MMPFSTKSLVLGSENIVATGNVLYINANPLYLASNPNLFASSGDIQNTGTALQNQIDNLNIPSVAGLTSSGDVASLNYISTGNADLRYLQTGVSGEFLKSANLNGLISTGSHSLINSVTGITVSGGIGITGAINIIGIYGTNVIQSGNTIGISGGGAGGGTVNNFTGSIFTGLFAAVTGISITGGDSLTGRINVVQGTNIVLTQLGNTGFSISGPASAGEANTASNLGGGIGVWYDKNSIDLRFNSISGGTGINVVLSGNVVFVDSNLNTGQFYPSSNPNQFIKSGDVAGLNYITTGNADLRYLQTGVSGDFLKGSNLVGLLSSGSHSLINSVTGISVSGGLAITGAIQFIGAYGTNVIQSGNTIAISGGGGGLSQLQADLLYLQTGVSGEFLKSANLNGLISTGSHALINSVTGITVSGSIGLTGAINFVGIYGSNVILSGNTIGISGGGGNPVSLDGLISTGSHSLIDSVTGVSISGGLAITGAFNINAGSNITLTQQGNNALSISSAGGGGALGGVTGISITGGISISGEIKIIGTGNVTVFQNGNTILVSGNTFPTGDTLPFVLGNINIVSGSGNSQFIQFSQNFAGTPIVLGNIFNNSGNDIVGFHTSGVSTSGFYLNLSDVLTTNNYYFQYLATTGLGYYSLSLGGQGGGGGGGTTTNITNNYPINSGSGIFLYRSGIASGTSKQFVNFPTTLDSSPIVITTVHNDLYDTIAFCQVSGANPTGFWALFSTLTENTGYYLDIYCSNSTATGMAANVIVNTTNNTVTNPIFYGVSGVTGISVTGSASMTGLINISAGSNITLTQNGLNAFSISSSAGGGGSITNGVTGISVTGGLAISGAIIVMGVGNVVTYQSGNAIIFSGITTLAQLYVGSGNPEGVVSAMSGSIYSDYFNKVQYNKFTGRFAYGWE